ncbi:MAG: class I SAM-dependent methyltransferase [Chloroflexota bacterium]
MDVDWAEYYAAVSGRSPRPLLLRALEAWGDRAPGAAVDLGAGDGTETLALLGSGWRVTAIDVTPASAEIIGGRVAPEHRPRLRVQTASIELAEVEDIDLVYAGFSLPFVTPGAFPATWSRILASLRPNGILAANLFGPNDTWATDPEMNFHDRTEVEGLLGNLEILSLDETDADGMAASGPKHWHLFDFVARRRT